MAKIKKDTSLRKAILQAAITGQLISNVDGETETGKQLLDRIIEERKKMSHGLDFANAKSGKRKSKKETALAGSNPCDIPEDEIPFEIPESWCWVRWGELSDSIQYGYNAPAKESGRIKMVRITDIQDGKVQWETVPYCEISEEEILSYKLKKNDILFARTGGTVGKSFLVDEEPEDAVYAGYLIRTQYDSEKLNPKYLKMFMESQLYWEQLKNGTIATAQPNCNGQTLSKMILPLPPLAVQNAIVAKLEEVLPLVDAYENAVLQKEELKTALPDKVKKAILQEAIQGKLTEEWRIDVSRSLNMTGYLEGKINMTACHSEARSAEESLQTGKQLLDRIIQERKKMSHGLDFANAKSGKRKSKKETALAGSNPCDIPEDEIPFEIPESWCWCRLSEYLDIRDGTHDSPKFYDTGIPFVTSKNLNNGKVDFSECKYITEEDHKKFSARSFVEDGDILFAMIGSIGNPVMVKKEFDFSFKNMALFKCYSKENTNMKYIYFYLCHIQKELKEIATGGVQSFIGLGTFRELLFPLPPLAEQKKIVEIIEQMLPLCEKLGG